MIPCRRLKFWDWKLKLYGKIHFRRVEILRLYNPRGRSTIHDWNPKLRDLITLEKGPLHMTEILRLNNSREWSTVDDTNSMGSECSQRMATLPPCARYIRPIREFAQCRQRCMVGILTFNHGQLTSNEDCTIGVQSCPPIKDCTTWFTLCNLIKDSTAYLMHLKISHQREY